MTGKPTYEELEQTVIELRREVSELKHLQEVFEGRLQAFAEAEKIGQVGIWEFTLETSTFRLSDGALRIFGMRPGENPGLEDFWSRVYPDDLDKVRAETTGRLQEKGASLLVEYRICWPEGSVHWVRSKGETLFDEAGAPIRVVGIVQDITERKEIEDALKASEKKYRLLVENAGESILIIQEGAIKFANPRFYKVMEYSPEETTRESFLALIHPEDLNIVRETHRRRMAGEDVPDTYSFRAVRKDGSTLWVEVKAALIEWEGTPATLNFLRNITGRKQMEEELEKHRNQLETLVKERTSELDQTNEILKREITDRMHAEVGLREKETALKANTARLEEMNAALKALLRYRQEDKTELEEKVLSNVKNLVIPYLQKLKKSGLKETQEIYLEILESNLNDIMSPFSRTLSSRYWNFTPTEIEVAKLIREGKTTKEIANLLNSSRKTIDAHRASIRKKLDLKNKKANLKAYLSTNSQHLFIVDNY